MTVNAEAVGQVRQFNRLVTQRVGALNDRFLTRERPLAVARRCIRLARLGMTRLRTLRPAKS